MTGVGLTKTFETAQMVCQKLLWTCLKSTKTRISSQIRIMLQSGCCHPLLKLNASIATFGKLITFMGRTRPEFLSSCAKRTIEHFSYSSYWFALMSNVKQWWIVGRVKSECIAICTYLRDDPTTDNRILDLLGFPAPSLWVSILALGIRVVMRFMLALRKTTMVWRRSKLWSNGQSHVKKKCGDLVSMNWQVQELDVLYLEEPYLVH